MSFQSFNFHPNILQGLQGLGFTTPTPIQIKSIPLILNGRDVIGLAQTGTGKTAAFALPLLQKLLTGPTGRVRGLIISPTRELAEQTCEVIGKLGEHTGLRSTVIYGGVNMDQQIRALRTGIDIVIACPGRLLDHIWKDTIDISHVEVLVIDEADRMFDMGFLPDIRNILKCLINTRQTLLFSATMPDDVRRLVHDVLHDPATVKIGYNAPVATVSHAIYPVKQQLKTALLVDVLRHTKTESVLVFTRTKHRTERVMRYLQKAGFKVTSLQGNLSQNRRQAAIDGFRAGSYKIMVATDIAARGIDILCISHVINYDMPDTVDAYTHRIGRTGRIDNTGYAFSFTTGEDRDIIQEIECILKTKIERRKIEGFNYDAYVAPDNKIVSLPRRFKPQITRNVKALNKMKNRIPVQSV